MMMNRIIKKRILAALLPVGLLLCGHTLQAQGLPQKMEKYEWDAENTRWIPLEAHLYEYDAQGRVLNDWILDEKGDTSLQKRYKYDKLKKGRRQESFVILEKIPGGGWVPNRMEKAVYGREGQLLEQEVYLSDSARTALYIDYREKLMVKSRRRGRYVGTMRLAADLGGNYKQLEADTTVWNRKRQHRTEKHYGRGLDGHLQLETVKHSYFDKEGRLLGQYSLIAHEYLEDSFDHYRLIGQEWVPQEGEPAWALDAYIEYKLEADSTWLPASRLTTERKGQRETTTSMVWEGCSGQWLPVTRHIEETDSRGNTTYELTSVAASDLEWQTVTEYRISYEYDGAGHIIQQTTEYQDPYSPGLRPYEKTVYSGFLSD